MKKYFFISIFLCFAVATYSQFVENVQPLQPVSEGVPCWGDYDGDGDLDLHISGYNITTRYWKIYKNNGVSGFADIGSNLVPARYSFSSMCDWDNDGDLDGVTTGWGGAIITTLWKNNGGDSFSVTGSLAGVNSGSMAWGDYDNDGDEDLLLNGWYSAGSATISRIYRNDKGTFVDIGAGLQGVQYSASSWCDYDNDGDLDILYTGNTGSVNYAGSYRNDSGAFTYVNLGLTGLNSGSISWGDYDADGDPDLLLTGYDGSSYVSEIYRNFSGTFTDMNAGLQNVASGNADWGDFDADGDLDIILNGTNATTKYTLIYINTGGIFTQTADILPGISSGAAKWGDYDYDGDLDLVIMGASSAGNITKIFRNDYGYTNTAPTPPTNLSLTMVDENYLQFSFDAGYDAPDPVASLTYNIQIDLLGDASNIKMANASIAGIKYLPVHGNIGHKLYWKYNRIYLPQESVNAQWKVQSVDLGFSGSDFVSSSPEAHFRDLELICNSTMKLEDSLYFEIAFADSILNYTLQMDEDEYFGSCFEETVSKSKSKITGYEGVALNELSFSGSLIVGETYYWRIRPNYSNSERQTGFSYQTASYNLLNEFTEISTFLDGVFHSSVNPGDYDNDGDLDITLTGVNSTGYAVSKLYRNDSGTYTDISGSVTIEEISDGSVSWGDFDKDNDLDILITGKNNLNKAVSKIYRNDSGSFTDISAPLAGVYFSSADWGDFDNDGDLDILITGSTDAGIRISKIYRNDSGIFTDISATLAGVYYGSAAWGDYDNDGDLDILITGYSSSNNTVSKIYRNDLGVFTDITAPLVGVYGSTVQWGDYDHDADLDILLMGLTEGGIRISKIYRNDLNGLFIDIDAGLTGLAQGSAAWGDYDNNGDLDILITGYNSSNIATSKVYKNISGIFTESSALLEGVRNSSAVWFDYDNDRDLDILLTGYNSSNLPVSKIYRNNSTAANTVPLPPSNLNTSVSGNDFIVSFNAGSDNETPASGLNYNIGIDINDESIKTEMSDLSSGYRKIVEQGNIGQNLNWTLKNYFEELLPQERTDVTLRVQAVDNCFAGSAFSSLNKTFRGIELTLVNNPEMSSNDSLSWESAYSDSITNYTVQVDDDVNFMSPFEQTVDKSKSTKANISKVLDEFSFFSSLIKGYGYYWRVRPNYSNINRISDFSQAPGNFILTPDFTEIATSLEGVWRSSVKQGDYDNDGDLDIILTGANSSDYAVSKLYRNDSGTYTDISGSVNIVGIHGGAVCWGDYDNDSDLDLLLTGYSNSYTAVSKIYRNDSGIFTDISASLTGVYNSSAAWGDYDNDGDLDLLIIGSTAGEIRISKIYRNDSGIFTDISASLVDAYFGSAAWGDYDNDGDLDIALTGWTSNIPVSKVYRNDSGSFTDIATSLEGVYNSSAAWGDYDNDGDLDILLTGSGTYVKISKVYRNDSGTFSDISASLEGVSSGSAAWGDYDNDGDLDILLTGMNGAGQRISKVYRNSAGVFTDISSSLAGVYGSSAAWGDYDNDGDLDILLTGEGDYNVKISKIYRNNSYNPNIAPLPPTGLNASIAGSDLLISFNAGSDLETPSTGLSYNLSIDVNDENIKPEMSDLTSGYRKIVETGNIGQKLGWTLKNCLIGFLPQEIIDLNIKAQTVDNCFTGSAFSTLNTSIFGIQLALVNNPEMNFNDSLFWESSFSDSITNYTVQVDEDVYFASPYEQTVDKSKTGKSVYITKALDELSFFTSLIKGQTYYWRIRPNYTYPSRISVFSSTPKSFILLSEFTDISTSMIGLAFGSSLWGDYDNDGDLDVFVTGQEQTTVQKYSIIYNNDNGVFNDINAGLLGMNYSYADWGDFDNDDDLDLVLIGDTTFDKILIYRNDSLTFTYIDIGISCSGYGSVKWGDKENDGDLDLLVTGRDAVGNEISKIIDNGDSTFTESNIGELSPLEWSCGDWADFDNDGDLDIVISGRGSIDNYTYVYLNNGGTFVLSQQLPLTIYRSCLDFGDYDNDGDLDLIIAGYSMMEGYDTKIYSNDNGLFFDSGIVLPGGQDGSVNWGDYDNDGDLDVLITGYSPTVITKIYLNESGSFTEFPVGLKPSNRGRASWGDYDNDGDLDILVSGRDGTFDYFTKIYRNNIQTPNTVPSPPSNILISTDFSNTTISFTPGSDTETPSAVLSYNMEFGLNDYSGMPSMSDSTGYRKIVRTGNIGQVNSWTLTKEIPEAIIPQEIMNFWCKVQSVDQAYSGSAFAQANRLIANRDLLIIPKEYMTRTDELVWEFVMSDSVASYTVQMATDTIFYPYYSQTLTFAKESKTGYVGVALQDLDFFASLTVNTEYYWRVKPNHVNPVKQTDFNSHQLSFVYNPILIPPADITISVSGQYVTLDWDSGKDAKTDILYKVYSSNNPYASFPSGWTLETSTTSTNYLVLSTAAKKFYCVTANNFAKKIDVRENAVTK